MIRSARYPVECSTSVQGEHSLPAAGPADLPMKKPRCNLLLQRGLQCRGDWIRTSDLLNPIQAR